MKTDFEIAHEAKLELIDSIAKKANIPTDEIEPFGKHIAKSSLPTYRRGKGKEVEADSLLLPLPQQRQVSAKQPSV